MTPVELRRQRAQKIAEARGVYEKIKAENRDPSEEERTRVDGLLAEVDALEARAIAAEQWSMIDTRLAEKDQSPGTGSLPHVDPSNTRRHEYSLLKALREASSPTGARLTGLELETHQELAKTRKEMGVEIRGILVPNDLPLRMVVTREKIREARASGRLARELRDLDTTAGAGSIPTILDTTMIDLLRARMVTRNMGAKVMNNMQGLFAIPRQTSAAGFYWVTQGGSVTKTNQTIDQVPFSPHTGGAQTAYTRQFLEQTNQDAEQFVREDFAAVVARGYETAALNGSGSAGQPLGILQNPLISVVALGTNGAAPDWANVVKLETTVATANADMGALGYITDAAVRGTLKTTPKLGSTFPVYIWNTEAPDFPVNGYPVGVTNLLPSNLTKGSGTSLHAMIYGNWNDMIYAFWSGLDIIVDPYTQAASGAVVMTVLQDGDVNVRHPESFAKIVDMIVS